MGTQKSSPGQLFTVAKAVAEHSGISTDYFLEITVDNAKHLYHRQKWSWYRFLVPMNYVVFELISGAVILYCDH